ncbi:MAG: hypothetical protein ACRCXD_02010, partial [Luteolibacter sp.]
AAQAGEIWQAFVAESTQGLSTAPPFLCQPTLNKAAFAPVAFPPVGGPPAIAAILSAAWAKFMLGTVWTVPAPVPPFSAITTVTPNPATIAAAQTVLFAGLVAEFLVLPPPGPAGLKIKSLALGTLFYTATLSSGVLLTGLGIGAPPPPLVLPHLTL